jgi:hypothetical protein
MYSVCGFFEGVFKSVGEPDLILKMDNRFRSGGISESEFVLYGFIPKSMGFSQAN